MSELTGPSPTRSPPRPSAILVDGDRSRPDPTAGDRIEGGTVVAGLVALLVVVSPFDLALPPDGWTGLHLRPLLVLTATVAAVGLVVARGEVDRVLAAGVGALVVGVGVVAVVSPDRATGGAVAARVAVLGGLFLAATVVGRTARGRRVLVCGVAVATIVAAVVGLAVLVAGGDRWGAEHLLGSISQTRGVVRLTRPFSHANVAAFVLAPSVMLTLVAAAEAPTRFERRLAGLAALLGSVALSLTLSRGGVLALLLVAAGLAIAALLGTASVGTAPVSTAPVRAASVGDGWIRRLDLAGAALAVSAVVVGVAVVSGRWVTRLDPSATAGPPPLSRPEIWGQAIDAVVGDPLTGVGPGRFGVHSAAVTPSGHIAAAHAHNPVLELAATGGLVALLGLVLFLAAVAARFWPGRHRVPIGLSAAAAVAILTGIVDLPFLFSSSGNLIAVVVGAAVGASRGDGR